MPLPPHLNLSPATPSDIPSLTNIYFSSFQNLQSLHCFPRTPLVTAWWHSLFASEITSPGCHFLKITDSSSPGDGGEGKVVAFAKWTNPEGVERAMKDEEVPTWPEEGDPEVCAEFFERLDEVHRKVMGERRHWYLEMLGTLPEYQGNGLGSALIRWGLEKADQEGLESYVEGAPGSDDLYRKFGWKDTDKVTIQIKDKGSYHNTIMVRQPAG